MKRLLCLLVVVAACGGDDTPAPAAKPGGGGAAPAAAAKKVDDKDKLQVRQHVEERVECPIPEKVTGPDCKPEAPTCEPGAYCIPTARDPKTGAPTKFNCEACPERDSIRHEFRDRDFIADQARDPFQSFVIVTPELGKPAETTEKREGPCKGDQLRATTYSFQDLKLVGLVGLGTRKTALMMNPAQVGEFIRRGDCVGKEKAYVSDIVMHDQTACITFQITPTLLQQGGKPAPPREVVICLYPNGLPVPTSQPSVGGLPTGTQVAPPPGTPEVAPPPSR